MEHLIPMELTTHNVPDNRSGYCKPRPNQLLWKTSLINGKIAQETTCKKKLEFPNLKGRKHAKQPGTIPLPSDVIQNGAPPHALVCRNLFQVTLRSGSAACMRVGRIVMLYTHACTMVATYIYYERIQCLKTQANSMWSSNTHIE